MKLYHGTRLENVEAILRDGFRDATGQYLTSTSHTGVWISDRPLLVESNLASDEGWFEIEVDESLIRQYEWIEEAKGYREWLVPADLLNRLAKVRRLSAEELSNLISSKPSSESLTKRLAACARANRERLRKERAARKVVPFRPRKAR